MEKDFDLVKLLDDIKVSFIKPVKKRCIEIPISPRDSLSITNGVLKITMS